MAMAGLEVVSFAVYHVAGHEYVGANAPRLGDI
jgi:hypothetical protein